jgi:heme-degrading monooxygenase HmoA
MVVSILMRKTRITDRREWEARLAEVLPRLREVMSACPGFRSVQYLWGVEDDGEFAQITEWATLEDCRRYVREGAAATVATIEDAAIPTAPYPNGAWVRKTFDAAGTA